MREALRNARQVVVKMGTSTLLDSRGLLDLPVVSRHLRDLAGLHRGGVRTVLVTSGAIGVGRARLGYDRRPTTIPELQATAAVGQALLMHAYDGLLAQEGFTVAQLLLTHDDFRDRRRYLNVRNLLAALEDKAAIPVVNENDTVSVDEIRLGDNDTLAALVAGLVGAQVTVLFTDVDGFQVAGRVVSEVVEVTPEMESAAGPGGGTGGMVTKLRAARTVTRGGGHLVLANGKTVSLAAILAGEPVGTHFVARPGLPSRGRWMQGLSEVGRLTVDAGGARALQQGGRSLLAVGVTACAGEFEAGDVVGVDGPAGPVAKGLCNYPARDLRKILGRRSSEIESILGTKEFDEVIHRDNLVLL
jgi:glutamate 5-kinase